MQMYFFSQFKILIYFDAIYLRDSFIVHVSRKLLLIHHCPGLSRWSFSERRIRICGRENSKWSGANLYQKRSFGEGSALTPAFFREIKQTHHQSIQQPQLQDQRAILRHF
jgi:hypothetical protein